ncbi:MAG: hypothetical protein IPG44_06900 [Anaerolineales bacterium]|nr:hypothetical protein [Anaerolineales bacterium]
MTPERPIFLEEERAASAAAFGLNQLPGLVNAGSTTHPCSRVLTAVAIRGAGETP